MTLGLYHRITIPSMLWGYFFCNFVLMGELDAQDQSLTAIRVIGTISLDGILDEPEWLRPGTLVLIQREPHEGMPGSEETEAWFAYDDDALYVAVRLSDRAPDSILGRLVRRDEDFESDFIYIGLDPKLDRNTGYYFGTNPSGSINDGIIYDDNKNDDSYDPVWDVAVGREAGAWTAEFRIPFSQLRFQESEEHVWGVDLQRRIHRKSEESLLVLHPRNDEIRVSRFSRLTGLRGLRPPSRIEVLPYAAATGKFLPSPGVAAFNQGRKDPFVFGRDYFGTVGADAKIGLSGDFTLDASINPDFAQVEVDPAVVNLTAYETYYTEKRPFFIEGSGILSFGRGGAASSIDYSWADPGFFYSRRIGRAPQATVSHDGFQNIPDRTTILGAAKVSGKTSDGWSLTALTALTNREYGEVDSAGTRFQEEIEPLTFYSVVRGQKQFNESRQSLGIIGTYVERDLSETRLSGLLGRHAFSVGVDGWTFLDESREWVINGWTGLTSVGGTSEYLRALQVSPTHWFQKPDASHVSVDSAATSLSGWAGRLWLSKDKGNWRFSTALGFIDPGFESNDLGFHTYTDVVNMSVYSGYLWFQPDPVFRTKSVSVAALREYNFGGEKTGETYYFSANGELLNYWGGSLYLGYNVEVLDDKRTRGGPLMKSFPSRFASFSAYSDTRDDLYGFFYLSGDRGESGGWDYDISFSLSWKLTTAVNLSFGPSHSRNHLVAQFVDAIPDPTAVETFGTRYVFGVLDRRTASADLRLNWTFTPRASLQIYLQPYISAGHYSNFRSLARPSTFAFDPYTYAPNPDFNFRSLRVNAVFRWEYLPGSTLYLVWTNEKVSYEEQNGSFSFRRDFSEMLRAGPANVFSVKVTYWWAP
ncbi:MAG: DUF5916 domain-containing protein [Bacteroidota bacterium]